MVEQPASQRLCGPGKSLCRSALDEQWGEDLTTAEPCAAAGHAADNDFLYRYRQWQPDYSSQPSRGNAFLNSSADRNRFGGQQVRQESYLQGRGQVTSSRACSAGKLTYLPDAEFASQPKPAAGLDMSLFAQPSVVPRSCASVTEVDLQERFGPRRGRAQGIYTPFPAETLPRSDRRLIEEGLTLSTKSYPTYEALKAAQDALLA
jgi:hypothetical protein